MSEKTTSTNPPSSQEATRTSRKPVLRWKGIFGDMGTRNRRLVLGMLALVSLALAFLQFGFVGIGADGKYIGYAVFQLVPVAATALLFGPGRGALMGLFTGAIMYVHALWMPLDYFEMEFVNPLVSFALFPLTGFLLGIFLAIALRNERSTLRHCIYAAVVAFIMSLLFSFLFAVNVMVNAIAYMVGSGFVVEGEASSKTAAADQFLFAISQMGDVGMQFWIDGLALAAICVIGIVAVRQIRIWAKKKHSIRLMFNLKLGVACTATLMLAMSVSFACISLVEISAAEISGEVELEYLYDQYRDRDDSSYLNGYLPEEYAVLFWYTPVDTGKPEVFLDNLPQNAHREGENLLLSDVLTADAVAAVSGDASRNGMAQVPFNLSYGEYTQADDKMSMLTDGRMSKTELRYAKTFSAGNGVNVTGIATSSSVHRERPVTMFFITMSILALLSVVFVLTSRLLKGTVIARIDETNKTLIQITGGDVKARAKDQDIVEFSSLSSGINTTVAALDDMIREAETKRDAELATAKTIQENALPMEFPAFPHIDKFDIYASMKTAKEVGGDFYDFFEIEGQSKIAFVLADVSGKGIPAALFMMTSKTQLRNHMEAGMEVDAAVNAANHQLCLGNDAGMFVTALICTLDYETGRIDYVNAGHNPPLVLHDGQWEWKKEVSGMPLGLFDGIPYGKFSFDLAPGDVFYLYTDGVTEAMNVQDELFGEKRLEEIMERYVDMNPRSIGVGVRRALTDFTQDAEQSDDITMLVLKYGVPPEEKAMMVLDAKREQLVHVVNYIHAELHRRHAPKPVYSQIDIACEELFVNVCSYAYPDATEEDPGEVRIQFEYEHVPPTLIVRLEDDGIPYNPLAKEDAPTVDTFGNIMDVPIGGLGILMAKNSVDEMFYERANGTSNVIIFKKSW